MERMYSANAISKENVKLADQLQMVHYFEHNLYNFVSLENIPAGELAAQ